ncbi:MAG TPA: S41 family peptidase [Ferruginibacter sp.]|nr:hypothetical protein [Chitinophagales bacterium]HQR00071.1 S41 family peptidase [Ferruginibacter sp.]
MKRILLLCLACTALKTQAQQPDSVRVFIDSALHVMQRHSVFTRKVNWKQMTQKVYQMTRNAKTYKEAAPGIKYAFDALGDKHGWLVLGEEEYRNPHFKQDTGRITDNMKQAASKGPKIYCGVVNDQYAYLSIPFFGGQTDEQMTRFAQRIQDSLCKVVNVKTKGIIIDLRLNAGGNSYPMLAGLANVFGSGDLSVHKDRQGKITERTTLDGYKLVQDGQLRTTLGKACGDLTGLPVAVIIGPITGSSGEGLAIALSARKKTILVGENTAGYTSVNNGFLLAGDQYGMVLAESFMTDRYGNTWYDRVRPTIPVTGGDDFFHHASDKKIQAAVQWLKKQEKR